MNKTPLCPECGSPNISADAAVRWDDEAQDWEIVNVFDQGKICDDCGAEFDHCDWEYVTARPAP